MIKFLLQFPFSILFTIGSVIGAGILLGPGAAITTAILIMIEVAFSFDNAVINAKVLSRMSRIWQQIFLTVGILIAVVGMRLVFPIMIVAITANLEWRKVLDLALNDPKEYAHFLEAAHITIASFGGAFLLVLVLYFFLDHTREHVWLSKIERPLQSLKGGLWLAPVIGALVITVIAFASKETETILRAGSLGVALYTVIHALIQALGKLTGPGKTVRYVGWGAALAFLYLEILDASFSFDGVLGAFAITNIVPIIAVGLGVGALWVRSLTVYMVRNGTLDAYRYLEHGAHYAIFVLVVALLTSIFFPIPDAITGILGLAVIAASIAASRNANTRHGFPVK